MQKQYEVQVLIHKGENGFWATVAEMPGVFAAGETHDELVEALNEAIAMYIDEVGIPPELTEERVEIQKFNLKKGGLVPA